MDTVEPMPLVEMGLVKRAHRRALQGLDAQNSVCSHRLLEDPCEL